MLGDLVKAAAYAKAPKLTFAVLHPKEAAQLKKLPFDLRTAYAPRLAAAVALLIAFPLGVAVGIRIGRRSATRQHSRRTRRALRGSRNASGRERPRRSERTNAERLARRSQPRFLPPPVESEPPPTFV